MKFVKVPADLILQFRDCGIPLSGVPDELVLTMTRLIELAEMTPDPNPGDSVLTNLLTRPLIVFDIESTGVDTVNDRICSLHWLKLFPDGEVLQKTLYFNPGKVLTEEVIAIHGLTNDFLEDYQRFSEYAPELLSDFADCDVAHFNGNHFDVLILSESFGREGLVWPLPGMRSIDASSLFRKAEGRSLADAFRFYLGEEMEGNHEAAADVVATFRVLKAILVRYPLFQDMNLDELHLASKFNPQAVDLAGKLMQDDEGHYRYDFGKHKGQKVLDEPGYARWMLDADFPTNTKVWLEKILNY